MTFRDKSPFATAVVTSAMSLTCAVSRYAMVLTDSVRSFHEPDIPAHLGLPAQLALGAHLAGHPGDLVGERRQLVDQVVDRTPDLQELPAQRMPGPVRRLRPQLHARRQIAVRDRRQHPADLGEPPACTEPAPARSAGAHLRCMADTTTVEVDTDVHDRLAVLAADRGLSLRAYLAELATAQENEAALARAARAFEKALERPGFREGFARDFGGLASHD